eukprot:6240808-Pyramimonas_sp.AAC.1
MSGATELDAQLGKGRLNAAGALTERSAPRARQRLEDMQCAANFGGSFAGAWADKRNMSQPFQDPVIRKSLCA